jgi:predicted AAA+ superfamily ATPase
MHPPLESIVARRLQSIIRARLGDEPAVGLQGARSVGKSTLLRTIADRAGTVVLDLDDLDQRAAVAADPMLFARGPAPVCIDEFQHVPEILDAVKAALNERLEPGRFVLTGSTRYEGIPRAAQSLTGRLHLLTVWPLSQGEVAGVEERFIARVLDDPTRLITNTASSTSRDEYEARVLAGGLPLALRRTGPARSRWFDAYVQLVIDRDVLELSRVRQRELLPRLLRRLAGQTGQILNVVNAARAAGLEPSTAENYTRLLEAVFLIHRLPAWGRTLRARATASPKVHVVDTGLGARLLGLTEAKLARKEPAAVTEFGHLLESFCVNEILKQLSWLDDTHTVGHWRTHDGAEVDLVIEAPDGTITGVEVKSSGRVTKADTAGLRMLRDVRAESFHAGIVLHAGTHAYTIDERIHAVPIDRLWSR